MRPAVLLRLAFGLLAVDSVVASPCIPGTTTTAVTSAASTETSSDTAELTTSVASATSTTAESSIEASASSTVTQSSVETSASSIETTVSSATTDSTTTIGDTTTSTTSTAPTVTFSIVATGSGPVEGKGLQTYPRSNSVALFTNDFGGSSIRPFHIDAEGRLINDQGFYLCGYYQMINIALNAPAEVGTCDTEYPLAQAFLKCQETADLKLTCSIPAITCVAGGNPNDIFGMPTCEAAAGTWDSLYFADRGPGDVLHIGAANAGGDYSPIELTIQVV
ncbi:hypothetical protein N0V84_006470 [Fusarium piperis]|uniref:Uncharacterized protein n=1 Tax=Fusarium piperis TaxID=1435070 RepID=A0A9W8WBS1_9HYPO|nr:hypothetical protein N0V84_006470 [Fusarium piperis]